MIINNHEWLNVVILDVLAIHVAADHTEPLKI